LSVAQSFGFFACLVNNIPFHAGPHQKTKDRRQNHNLLEALSLGKLSSLRPTSGQIIACGMVILQAESDHVSFPSRLFSVDFDTFYNQYNKAKVENSSARQLPDISYPITKLPCDSLSMRRNPWSCIE